MANTVIKNAFRIIPMIPLDYHLLWFSWNGNCYFDMFLSLSASSSIFFSNLMQLYNRLLYRREGNVSYLRRFLFYFSIKSTTMIFEGFFHFMKTLPHHHPWY